MTAGAQGARAEGPGGAHLAATRYLDTESPEVRGFVARALAGAEGAPERERAIRLFDAVRDGIRYDPYSVSTRAEDYRAGRVLQAESAFCVPKAIALTACLRAAGIPARAGFADVRNHLNSPKLAELMGTDVFMYHGYVEIELEGARLKATPAFNMELCERFGVRPLIFDGRSDALFHEFDEDGRRHMEYVRDRGVFEEPPVEEMLEAYRAAYPRLHAMARAREAGEGGGPADAAFAPGA